MNRGKAPAFLGIGPPKTATSWLYAVLKLHPEVKLPPLKEIGYLWEKRFFPERNYLTRFTSDHWYYQGRREYIRHGFRRHLRQLAKGELDVAKLWWLIKYALPPHTDAWYSRLFSPKHLSGDITPKYSELQEPDLHAIRESFGEPRIIITLRDPVEREWSRAKMNLCKKRNRSIEDVTRDEWIEEFNHLEQSNSNEYTNIYLRWKNVFGHENLQVIFFDEVIEDAWTVFHKVCEFLKISPPPESLKQQSYMPVNAGISEPMPAEFRQYLFAKHEAKMRQLVELFPEVPYPQNWITRNETLLR